MREFLTSNIALLKEQLEEDDLTEREKIEKYIRYSALLECLTFYMLDEMEGRGPMIMELFQN